MNKEFCESQKQKLIAQRNELLDSLAGQNEQLKKLVENVESGDDVDIASDTIDRALLKSLGDADARRLQMINNAIDRINQGKYGTCLLCGKDIPLVRLEAIPYAALCVDCQTKEERRNR